MDLLENDFFGSSLAARLLDHPEFQVTSTFLDGWAHVRHPLRETTLDLMNVVVRGNQHPSMQVVPLGGGMFAVSAPFEVELAFYRRPDGRAVWLSVAC